jgi:hypothetical protein
MSVETLTANIRNGLEGLSKCRKKFMLHLFLLLLALHGRVNFVQLGRYGSYNESTFRKHFKLTFYFFPLILIY